MDFTPIFIKKAAKIRRNTYYAYLVFFVLTLLIGALVYAEGTWPSYPAAWKASLLLSAAMVFSAFGLAQADYVIKPEESADKVKQAKIRNGTFLLGWEAVLLVCVLVRPSFFFLFALFILIVYACCIQTLHFYFNTTLHPTAPKNILLALPVQAVRSLKLSLCTTGIIFFLFSVIILLIWLIPPGVENNIGIWFALFLFILALLFSLIGFSARFGSEQNYFFAVLEAFGDDIGLERKAQLPLFKWCLTHPGDPNPPLDLLMQADEQFVFDNHLAAPPTKKAPLEKLEIGSQANRVAQADVLPPSQTITPLMQAAMEKNLSQMQRLLPSLQINQAYAGNGNTPLHIAVWNGNAEMVKLLLAQPYIDKTAQNLAGKTPLDLAREKHFAEIIALLESK